MVGYSVDTAVVVTDTVVGSSVEELVEYSVEVSGGDVRGSPVKVSVSSDVDAVEIMVVEASVLVDAVVEVVVGARVVVGPSVTEVVGASVDA